MTNPRTRLLAVLGSATAAAAALIAVVPAAAPAVASGITLHRSTKTTITTGVQRWSIWWNNKHGHQHGYVESVNLTVSGLSLRPGLGHGMVNNRETTLGIAKRTTAVAGINGDLFDWDTSLPWGGVAINGGVYKPPPTGRVSQFYVTADGKAGIGALDWSGAVTLLDRHGKARATRAFYGVNTPQIADNGRLALFTPAITGQKLAGCAAVKGSFAKRVLTVSRVYAHIGRFGQLGDGRRLLAACGTGGRWLRDHVRYHQRLRVTQKLTTTDGRPVSSFISGQRALRLNGARYSDRDGFHTSGINPETAACVSRDGLHVLLIVVDGWLGWAGKGNGVTLPELGKLAAALRCYSTVVFDGGGSTTMVEQHSGDLQVVNAVPAFYGQRPVSDALLVFTS